MRNLPNCPGHLSEPARKIWRKINSEYLLEPASLEILKSALEAYDRLRDCQAILQKEGLTVSDRFGQTRGHPLLATERDSRGHFVKALKSLGLGYSVPERD